MNVSVGTGNDAASFERVKVSLSLINFYANLRNAILISALISCIKVTRPNADAGHDAGCSRNATAGKVRQVQPVHSSSKGGPTLPAFILRSDAQ